MPLIIDLDQSRDREVKYNLVCLGRRARLRPVLPLLVNSAVRLPLYIDQARSRMEQALSDARRLAHPQTLAALLFFANRVDWITRSPQVHIEEVLALSTQHDFRHYWGWALAFRGRSLIAFGHASEGLASLMEGRCAWLAFSLPIGVQRDEERCLTGGGSRNGKIVQSIEKRRL